MEREPIALRVDDNGAKTVRASNILLTSLPRTAE